MPTSAANIAQSQGNERRIAAQPLRVVVADDERDIVDTLSLFLRDAGHTVYSVYTGKQVLPTVRVVRPDAIIIDIAICGMSGYAVAQEIRHTFLDLRRPLLIGISGFWRESPDKMVARQAGFDHYLDKPCDPNAVLEILAQPRR
ncbi:MAG TPA: response regulator [Burkholderiales bacterium]|jgi:DNA-binding response OmpR family regulator|nr:response regulator [Burkholderiales bacterium]